MTNTYEVNQLRIEYPNAYKPWTAQEDAELVRQHKNGRTSKELAGLFQRKGGAITSRLKKLSEPKSEPEPSDKNVSVAIPTSCASVPRLNLSLTQDQKKAQEAILAWCQRGPKQVLTLGGYAGTGKTTVIAETIRRLSKRPRIAFCCYTGKAADILREKLVKTEALKTGDYCGTIHGLIYDQVRVPAKRVDAEMVGARQSGNHEKIGEGETEILWRKKDSIKADLIVVDEASMISKEIWNDLGSFGAPILAVGDHGQLPPVGDKYNLMENPAVRLETIHRQAEESPIIKLSIMARQEGKIPFGEYGPSVIKTRDTQAPWQLKTLEKVMFLCGRNKTRVNLNAQIRERLGIHSPEPIAGDRVICLRNSRRYKVFNGMLGTALSIKASGENLYRVKISMDSDVIFKGRIVRAQFGQERTLEYEEGQSCLFDWGYALTVHKAQGSENKQVVLFEERFAQMDDDQWRRWLYTGVTRASEELIIVGV